MASFVASGSSNGSSSTPGVFSASRAASEMAQDDHGSAMPTNNGHDSADEMSASDTQELDHDHGDMALSNRQDWMVILRNAATQQVVLYNKTDPKLVIMPSRRLSRQQTATAPPSRFCALCRRPFQDNEHPPNDFMDKNYFRLLSLMPLHEPVVVDNEATHSDTADDPTVAAGATATTTAATEQPQDGHLASHSFNQGYYSRFFVELRKLGRGLRGSVFLCQHILDDIYLGEYAIKKVAVGDNHPWLARMLREVHLLEKLHHPNIINYKHAWLENHQHSAFGPQIPSLFILMECANGGNLEEYIDIEERVRVELAAMTPRERARRVRKDSTQAWPGREQAIVTGGIGLDSMGRKVRFLKTDEILSLLYDIASGLEHLHKHGIIHRDLKPPNLLLSFADPNNKNQTPRVLISDFGECEMLGEDALRARTGATGTIDFTAPELLETNEHGAFRTDYSQKADIWSLGLILYYLCFSALPYRQVDDVEQLRSEILAFNGAVLFPEDTAVFVRVPALLCQMIASCMSINPSQRPSATDVVRAVEHMQAQQAQGNGAEYESTVTHRMPTPRLALETARRKASPSPALSSSSSSARSSMDVSTRDEDGGVDIRVAAINLSTL